MLLIKASYHIKRGHLWAEKKEGRFAQGSLDTTEIKLEEMNSSLPGKEIIAYGCPFYEAMEERLHQPSTLTQAFLIIITVVHILTFPLTAALNALVMFAVKMNSRLRAHKSNIGLALLALTDFFVGVLAQPAFIALIISLLVDDDSSRSCTLPNFTIAVSRIGVSVSLVHTVLISGERYLAVRHSFAYVSLVTEARLLVASVLAWLLSITLHIPVAVNESVFLPIKNTLYGLCVVLIIFCHVTVYLEIRRHQKHIVAQQVTEEAREQFQKDKKAFKVTFIVIVVLMLCSFPIVTFTEVLRRYRGKLSLGVFYIYFFLATLMASLNSFFNPLIYTFRLREFRVALIGLICRTVNIAEAEQIEMKIFGAPNAVARIEVGQGHQGQAQRNAEQAGQRITNNNNVNNNDVIP